MSAAECKAVLDGGIAHEDFGVEIEAWGMYENKRGRRFGLVRISEVIALFDQAEVAGLEDESIVLDGSSCFTHTTSINRGAGAVAADSVCPTGGSYPSDLNLGLGGGNLYRVYAIWTPASAPAVPSIDPHGIAVLSSLLLGLGLAGMAGRRRA